MILSRLVQIIITEKLMYRIHFCSPGCFFSDVFARIKIINKVCLTIASTSSARKVRRQNLCPWDILHHRRAFNISLQRTLLLSLLLLCISTTRCQPFTDQERLLLRLSSQEVLQHQVGVLRKRWRILRNNSLLGLLISHASSLPQLTLAIRKTWYYNCIRIFRLHNST